MIAGEQGLEAFRDAVMAEAREDRDRVLEEGRRDVLQMRRQAEARIEEEAQSMLDLAQQQADRAVEEARAKAQLDAQALRLRRREALLDDVLSDVRSRLSSAQQDDDYPAVVERLVREAVARMGDAEILVIRGDETALAILRDGLAGDLASVLDRPLVVGEPLSDGVGVIVETEDGHRRYDNTLHERLNRRWDALRAPVYARLRGEEI